MLHLSGFVSTLRSSVLVVFSKLLQSLKPIWDREIEYLMDNVLRRNKVFNTNSNFRIPISLQPYSLNLGHCKLGLFDLTVLKFSSFFPEKW